MIKLYKAFLYSLSGLKLAFRDEFAFRLEVFLLMPLVPAAFLLAPDKISLILLLGSLMLVLIAELLNTAVESAINRISADIHPLARKAKDTASAAVLVALINAAMVWIVILIAV